MRCCIDQEQHPFIRVRIMPSPGQNHAYCFVIPVNPEYGPVVSKGFRPGLISYGKKLWVRITTLCRDQEKDKQKRKHSS